MKNPLPNHKSNQKSNKVSKQKLEALLDEWNKALPESVLQANKHQTSRRIFMMQSMGLIAAMPISSAIAKNLTSPLKTPLAEPWLTIAEVQEHLFPTTTEPQQNKNSNLEVVSPGAKDIQAIKYLQTILNTPDADVDETKFIMKGVDWLNGVANNLFGLPFIRLDQNKRERVLRKISKTEAGENWISTLLRYIFEALLTDPIYGGNPNGVGWKWLQHQAGFPRPPENKKYWLLGSVKTKLKQKVKQGD